MKTAEEKGREFLTYVGENATRLKWNLSKNVSYEPDLFEDVFSYTILRIYDSIVKRGLEIQDPEQYFFNASRLNYLKMQERSRRRSRRHIDINEAWDISEEKELHANSDLEKIKAELECIFGEESTRIYLGYMRAKTEGRISYKTYSERMGIEESKLARVCMNIKRYLRN